MTQEELRAVLEDIKHVRIGTIVVVGCILDCSLLVASLISKDLSVEELHHLISYYHREAMESTNLLRVQLQINVLKTL